MALTPEPMQRAVIVSSKGYQPQVIETLHRLRVAHLIDYHDQTGEFAEFKAGAPLPAAGPASEKLVRVRAILRHLGLEGAEPARGMSAAQIEGKVDAQLDVIEREVNRAIEVREQLRNSLQEGQELTAKLAPLQSLPLRLEDYRGYDGLTVFVGRADPAFEAAVLAAAPDGLIVKSADPHGVFALFVPRAQAQAASDALYKNGYAEVEVPAGTGTPEERLRALASEGAQLATRAAQSEADLARLAKEHRDLLLAAEEHLTILVEKAEAPQSFASSENAFLVDAWIPASQVNVVDAALRQSTYGNVHFQVVGSGGEHSHSHAENGAHADAAYDAEPTANHHVDKRDQPPTKYDNPRATARFEWFTELFATPRYDEVDPTTLFAFFFPLFFGFMVGDLGLGLLIALIGWLLIRKLPKVDGMKQLGTAFVAAGLVAAVFGGVVFHDAMGIPFGFTHHMEDELTAEGLAVACTPEVYTKLGETTWGCLLGGNAYVSEPLIGKVTHIPTILLLSLAAAFVHLALGLLIGIRNEWGHGGKHVAAKLGYMLVLLSFFPAASALLEPTGEGATPFALGLWHVLTYGLPKATAYMAAGAGFVVGAVILGWAEGAPGVLEIPTIFSNILSYLRLGAVAVAKGAMAVAFNGLTLIPALAGAGTGNYVLLAVGIVGFLIAQIALLVLGILSGGIQSLRLNFVEMYTKFYKGGGTPYKPFGRARRTTTSSAPAHAAATTIINP